MKTRLPILIILSALLIGSAKAEPKFTKEQVIELGRVVLAADVNKEYKPYFWDAQPSYNEEKKLWTFYGSNIPVTPGGSIHIFELRETDGFYRLGWVSNQKSSSGFDKFRIQSSVRGKLTDLLKSYEKP